MTEPASAAGPAASPPVTPRIVFGSPVSEALEEIRRRPWLLLPVALTFVLTALGSAAVTLVHAWSVPTMLHESGFVFTAEAPAADVTAVVGAVLSSVAGVALQAVVVLLAGAQVLDVRAGAAATLREVGRRWALVLASLVGLLLAGVVPYVLLYTLALVVGGLAASLMTLLLTAFLVAGAVAVAQLFVCALLHGFGLRAARRRVADLRRWPVAREELRRAPMLVLGVVVLAVGIMVVLQRIARAEAWRIDSAWARGAPEPRLWVEVVLQGAQAVAGSLVLTVSVVALTWLHVRATSAAERLGEEPLAWVGVRRAMRPVAVEEPAAGHARPARRTALTGWTAVVGTWLLVPLVAWGPAALNPTPALAPSTETLTDVAAPTVVGGPDGARIVPGWSAGPLIAWSDDGLVRHAFSVAICGPRGSCVVDQRDEGAFSSVAVAVDPGTSAMVVLAAVGTTDEHPVRYEVVRCETDCTDPARRASAQLGPWVPEEWWWSSDPRPMHAVAARDGAFAAVYPVMGADTTSLVAAVCWTASCTDPAPLALGPVWGDDIVHAGFAADGVLWVARLEDGILRLARAEPGATQVTDVQVLVLGEDRDALTYRTDEMRYGPLLDLAVPDDGRPVVLYRAPEDGGLRVLACADDRCVGTTTSTVPGGLHDDAEIAVDSTGRPLVATVSAGVQLHACDDHACTTMRTGLMTGQRPASPWDDGRVGPFFAVDGDARPYVVVNQRDDSMLVRCDEPRCGL
ncbi:hypothetical protein [Cellulomonas xiejunii]|uniref:ABC3 transporter permease protein domain-containing protein n=1 Tax=Cellulomonas xiejunii TaxID=2968083 RepID=A0ABY5KNW7_9CELL|nr:hypothetical protein [Cellulomonas xiejunii]MCC2319586.1 hypothetical protein [Cellulomonas xiejunii]UUI71469.1 hypothetical protein NP048_17010 [Cellulomonas xiejunii]